MGSIVGVHRGVEEAFKAGRTHTREKVFSVVEHPDQNTMGTPLGKKAEATLALTLHYGQHETRDGEV